MLMEQHQTFGPDPTNVASARHFVGGTLAGWGLDASEACLLTSEVVTNAVVHARTDFTVTVKGDERLAPDDGGRQQQQALLTADLRRVAERLAAA
jgi:hypothetical protein